jgi:hypothetical protein
MRRGSTPTLNIETNIVVANFDRVILTVQQGDNKYNFEKEDMTQKDGIIAVTMSQAQTLSFDIESTVSLQFRVKKGTTVTASNIVTVPVCDVLNEEVLL